MIKICGPRGPRVSGNVINTTSRSKTWSKGLSPFFLGPVRLYRNFVAQTVENAWQYSKVYAQHVGEDGLPNEDYWNWAMDGWAKKRADRYPMGKGVKPEFSYWDGERLTYIEARKKVYIPIYASTVRETEAFAKLKEEAARGDVWLWDFDGYDHKAEGLSYDQVINSPARKMGHGFVLAMMLEGVI